MMAQLYDVPGLSDELEALRSVDVHYVANVEPYNPNRALLFAGWLAARLDWSLEEAVVGKTGGYIFRFGSGEREIKVEVVEGHSSSLEKGELTGVFVVAGEDAPYVMPRLALGEGQNCLEMRLAESERTAAHVIPYPPRSATELLAEALSAGHDPDGAKAIEQAGRLLAAVG